MNGTAYGVGILLLLNAGCAAAWGPEGHSIVAEIAQQHMSPTALAEAKWLLGGEVSLASISSWADDERDVRPDTYNWHFVDIPLSEVTYDPSLYCKSDPVHGDCIINAIERARAQLADTKLTRTQRAEALKYLVHFVADVHQPLHTVEDNRGENTLSVTFFIDPKRKSTSVTNLHVVWDAGLIRCLYWDWGAYASWLENESLPRQTAESLQSGTPADWALESHKIAIDFAAKDVAMNDSLGEEYITRVRPELDRQLTVAGLRLARLLNEALE